MHPISPSENKYVNLLILIVQSITLTESSLDINNKGFVLDDSNDLQNITLNSMYDNSPFEKIYCV